MQTNFQQAVNPVEANVQDIKFALEHDEEFFLQFFLGDELTKPVPSFHIDLFHLMTSTAVGLCAFAVPRDHAKTTLAKLACVFYYLFSPYSFIIYLGNTSSTAIPAVNDIANFFQTENFTSVFGEAVFTTKQDGIGFYVFTIQLTNEKGELYEKTCILKALGSGQSVRGINVRHRRPQLAVVDDLEDIENIATDDLFMKLKKWFYGTFRKCLDKFDHKIIHIGNMISNKCLLKEHCESEYWFSRRYGCLLSNGKVLWPDAWPMDKLKKDFNEYLQAGMMDVWFAEMMNMPIGSGRGLIKANEIFYAPEVMPGDIEYGFMTVDLATSEETWAHETTVVVHGWVGDHWQNIELAGGVGIDPIQLFEIIIALAYKWQINVVGIESVAFQASLKYVFQYLCMERFIENMLFVDTHARQRKVQRLASWAAMIKNKSYALTQGDFVMTGQLLEFNPKVKNNDDDYIDAAAYAVEMIDSYILEIQEQIAMTDPAPVQNSYEVARI